MRLSHIIWSAALVTTLFSCSNDAFDEAIDETNISSQNKVTMTLKLNIDGSTISRSIENEDGISNVFVSLSGEAVENGKQVYSMSATDLNGTSLNLYRLNVGKSLNIRVWANSEVNASNVENLAMDLKDEYSNGLSMYGETLNTTVVSSNQEISVHLIRNVAKISFVNCLADNSNDGNLNASFTVTGVYIVNAKSMTNLTPNAFGSVEEDASYYGGWGCDMIGEYKGENTYLENLKVEALESVQNADFYVYENTYTQKNNHTLLIIKGVFDDDLTENYYRIEVNPTSGTNKIVRNTHYTINLNEVLGKGTDDPFNDTKDANLTITSSLEPWLTGSTINGGNLE